MPNFMPTKSFLTNHTSLHGYNFLFDIIYRPTRYGRYTHAKIYSPFQIQKKTLFFVWGNICEKKSYVLTLNSTGYTYLSHCCSLYTWTIAYNDSFIVCTYEPECVCGFVRRKQKTYFTQYHTIIDRYGVWKVCLEW